MIVLKDNERLYLDNWNYNAALIMSELAVIVENHGGIVKPEKTAIISNRTIDEVISKYEKDVNAWNELDKERTIPISDACKKARKARIDKLEKVKSIDNTPIKVTHTTYIRFMLDNTMYYYQVDDNPFFDFYYTKTPIINGEYSENAICENDKKEWLFDCFLSWNVSKSDIREAANIIFNMLVSANNSKIWRDSRRVRVSNTYNNGYHYETVYNKERKKNIKDIFGA